MWFVPRYFQKWSKPPHWVNSFLFYLTWPSPTGWPGGFPNRGHCIRRALETKLINASLEELISYMYIYLYSKV